MPEKRDLKKPKLLTTGSNWDDPTGSNRGPILSIPSFQGALATSAAALATAKTQLGPSRCDDKDALTRSLTAVSGFLKRL